MAAGSFSPAKLLAGTGVVWLTLLLALAPEVSPFVAGRIAAFGDVYADNLEWPYYHNNRDTGDGEEKDQGNKARNGLVPGAHTAQPDIGAAAAPATVERDPNAGASAPGAAGTATLVPEWPCCRQYEWPPAVDVQDLVTFKGESIVVGANVVLLALLGSLSAFVLI